MPDQETGLFARLKKEIEQTYRQAFPECTRPIEEWKGQDIVNFQEELMAKVKGRISEKWFYTHLKSTENKNLPRIDMLDLLSRYAGYRSWEDFGEQKGAPGQTTHTNNPDNKKKKRIIIAILFTVILIPLLMFRLNQVNKNNSGEELQGYHFCFIDEDSGIPIKDSKIEITVLRDNESPVRMESDSSGCIHLNFPDEKIKFAVSSPYFRSDTIVRSGKEARTTEEIKLKTDNYALMIHIFSKQAVKDWEKRRQQLSQMIDDDAVIFQVYGEKEKGMEMYNKEEFIDKLTMPLPSLKSLDVISTEYRNGKISSIRFRQGEEVERGIRK
jgi:hypothetical protein